MGIWIAGLEEGGEGAGESEVGDRGGLLKGANAIPLSCSSTYTIHTELLSEKRRG